MKNLITFLLLFSSACFAQQKIELGYNVGIGVGVLKNFPNDIQSVRYGNPRLMAGINLGYHLTPNISLLANLNYEEKGGYQWRNDIDKINIHYLTLPVMLRIETMQKKKVSPYVAGGVYFSKVIGSPDFESYKGTTKVKTFTDSDYGLSSALGVKLKTKRTNYFSEVRLSKGMQDIQLNSFKVNNLNLNFVVGSYFSF